MRVVLDTEANGLLDTVTQLWCAVAYDIDEHQYYEFILKDGNYEEFKRFMGHVDVWIGHHIIGYDIPLLRKLGVHTYTGGICDTLVMSRTLNPDRQLPEGCPTHMTDPTTGKKKQVGAHGLEAWGYRADQAKPQIDRWDQWSPDILHRCKEDVGINYKALMMMMEEANLTQLVTV
jgi:hypothetical protein